MNFKKYTPVSGEKGLYYDGYQALADALGDGVVTLVQTARNFPGATEFLRIGWEVIITFPRQPSVMFHLGSYSDKKAAEKTAQAAKQNQERIKAEKRASAVAERARNNRIRQEVREEMDRVAAMSPEEREAYWREEARKHTENMKRLDEALERLKEKRF